MSDGAAPVLLYHKVDSRVEPGITRTTPSGFRRQMRFLKSRGYLLSSLANLVKRDNVIEPKQVGLTFDDAYESVYKHALPILRECGFSATVFIPSDFIGKVNRWDHGRFGFHFHHMDKQQLAEWIKAGGEVGCHGAGHRHFKLVGNLDRYREIVESRKRLEDLTGSPVRWFAPPFGWYDRQVLELVGQAGYTGVATVRERKSVTPPPGVLVVPRSPVYLGDGRAALMAKLEPESQLHRVEAARLALIHGCSWGTVAVQAVERSFSNHANLP